MATQKPKTKTDRFDDYDEEILDVDEITGTDVKINPDFYIHTAILKAQEALSNENVKEGFLKYRIFVEHIEVLCRAASMLSESYQKDIDTFKESKEYKSEKEPYVQNALLSNKKLELLMNQVFANKVSTVPMKDR